MSDPNEIDQPTIGPEITIAAGVAKVGGGAGITEPVLVWGSGTVDLTGDGPTIAPPAAPPVFVIGSGSAERDQLLRILNRHPELSAHAETGLLAQLARFAGESQEDLAFHGYPEQYWFKSAGEEFATHLSEQAAREDKRQWVAGIDLGEV